MIYYLLFDNMLVKLYYFNLTFFFDGYYFRSIYIIIFIIFYK